MMYGMGGWSGCGRVQPDRPSLTSAGAAGGNCCTGEPGYCCTGVLGYAGLLYMAADGSWAGPRVRVSGVDGVLRDCVGEIAAVRPDGLRCLDDGT